MGSEASYQAMPEDCDLFVQARHDPELAWMLTLYHRLSGPHTGGPPWREGKEIDFYKQIKLFHSLNPLLRDRHYYAGTRMYDAIHYLLSSSRRALSWNFWLPEDNSLIYKAIYGVERLHPEARAGQGQPIVYVPAPIVIQIAKMLSEVTIEQLHEHYKPVEMDKAGVYKIHSTDDEETFHGSIMEEFSGMREVYNAAAEHHEAMIIEID